MHPAFWTPKFPGLFVNMKFSLLFPENESLDLGLDAPEVQICAGKPERELGMIAYSKLNQVLFKSYSNLNR